MAFGVKIINDFLSLRSKWLSFFYCETCDLSHGLFLCGVLSDTFMSHKRVMMVLLSPKGIIAPPPFTVRNMVHSTSELENISAQGEHKGLKEVAGKNVNIFIVITLF